MNSNFTQLDSIEKLEKLFEQSSEKSVILFKHSNACPISRHAFEVMSDFGQDANLVVVQESPEVSKAIAQKTGVQHESPQVLVLRDGAVTYHAAHYDITTEDLNAQLN